MASSDCVIVDDADPRIQYSPGWQAFENGAELDGTKHGAAAAGLTATLSFTGTQVVVVGSLGSVDVHGVPTTLYTLDGSDAGSYTAPIIPPGFAQLNVTFFTSKTIAPGDHTLIITNINGTSPNVFWLDYIEYIPSAASTTTTTSSTSSLSSSSSSSSTTTTTASSSSTSSSSSHPLSESQPLTMSSTPPGSSSTPSQSATTSGSDTPAAPPSSQTSPPSNSNTSTTPGSASHTHAGAIAGGIVGGAALVLALALLLVYLRRRRRLKHASSPFADPDPPIRPFGSWRSAGADEAPSQKQVMTAMSTPTLSATLSLPTPTPTGLSPPPPTSTGVGSATDGTAGPRSPYSSESAVASPAAGGGQQQQLSPRSRPEPRVMQSVDSGLRLGPGEAVLLPPPYTRE